MMKNALPRQGTACGVRLGSELKSAGALRIATGISSGLVRFNPPNTCTPSPNWALETIGLIPARADSEFRAYQAFTGAP